MRWVNEALGIYRERGALQRTAIALNTRARIYLDQGKLREALQDVINAHDILEDVGSVRSLGMCLYREGEIRRRLARSELDEVAFDKAFERYEEAIKLLDLTGEPFRPVEARQGLGCTYRNRGYVRVQLDKLADEDFALALHHLQSALDLLRQELAKIQTQQADEREIATLPLISDILEDMAVVYVHQNQFAKALALLGESGEAIPKQYSIPELVAKQGDVNQQQVFWLRLGQVEMQRAICYFRQSEETHLEGCKRLLLAFAAFEKFGRRAKQIDTLHKEGLRELERLRNLAHIKWLHRETFYYATQNLGMPANSSVLQHLRHLFEEALINIELL